VPGKKGTVQVGFERDLDEYLELDVTRDCSGLVPSLMPFESSEPGSKLDEDGPQVVLAHVLYMPAECFLADTTFEKCGIHSLAANWWYLGMLVCQNVPWRHWQGSSMVWGKQSWGRGLEGARGPSTGQPLPTYLRFQRGGRRGDGNWNRDGNATEAARPPSAASSSDRSPPPARLPKDKKFVSIFTDPGPVAVGLGPYYRPDGFLPWQPTLPLPLSPPSALPICIFIGPSDFYVGPDPGA